MRPGPAVTVCIVLALALVMPGCGEGGSATAGGGAGPRPRVEGTASAAKRTCRGQLRGFLDSMDGLREKLAVGLSYGEYLREVRAARAAYAGVPVDRLGLGCLVAAGTPAERALNHYADAANTWGDCLALVSCDSESVEPELQRKWALASDQLSSARQWLRGKRRD